MPQLKDSEKFTTTVQITNGVLKKLDHTKIDYGIGTRSELIEAIIKHAYDNNKLNEIVETQLFN